MKNISNTLHKSSLLSHNFNFKHSQKLVNQVELNETRTIDRKICVGLTRNRNFLLNERII